MAAASWGRLLPSRSLEPLPAEGGCGGGGLAAQERELWLERDRHLAADSSRWAAAGVSLEPRVVPPTAAAQAAGRHLEASPHVKMAKVLNVKPVDTHPTAPAGEHMSWRDRLETTESYVPSPGRVEEHPAWLPTVQTALEELARRLDRQQLQIDSLVKSQLASSLEGALEQASAKVSEAVGPLQEEQRKQHEQLSAAKGATDELRQMVDCIVQDQSRVAARAQQLEQRLGAVEREAKEDFAALKTKIDGAAAVARQMQQLQAQAPAPVPAAAAPAPPPPLAPRAAFTQPAAAPPAPAPALPLAAAQSAQAPVGRKAPEAVVFLDVDGVLHSLYGEDLFKDSCCKLLEHILRNTGASIVLSSTWRTEPGKVAMINGLLQQRQLAPIHDCTKELADVRREAEICEWLDRHPGVSRWIAIDDMDLQSADTEASRRMRGHVVRTNLDSGLTLQDAEQAVRLLQGQGGSPPSTKAASPTRAMSSPQSILSPMSSSRVSNGASPASPGRTIGTRSFTGDARQRLTPGPQSGTTPPISPSYTAGAFMRTATGSPVASPARRSITRRALASSGALLSPQSSSRTSMAASPTRTKLPANSSVSLPMSLPVAGSFAHSAALSVASPVGAAVPTGGTLTAAAMVA